MYTDEKPSTEVYADTVLARENCQKHQAKRGEPCWTLHSSAGAHLMTFCNKRARRAGFVHRISEKSLRSNRPEKKR